MATGRRRLPLWWSRRAPAVGRCDEQLCHTLIGLAATARIPGEHQPHGRILPATRRQPAASQRPPLHGAARANYSSGAPRRGLAAPSPSAIATPGCDHRQRHTRRVHVLLSYSSIATPGCDSCCVHASLCGAPQTRLLSSGDYAVVGLPQPLVLVFVQWQHLGGCGCRARPFFLVSGQQTPAHLVVAPMRAARPTPPPPSLAKSPSPRCRTSVGARRYHGITPKPQLLVVD